MSDRRMRSPYPRPISPMDSDTINRAAEAMRIAAEAVGRATVSLNRHTGTASSTTGEHLRRKPVVSESPRPRIHTGLKPREGDMESPNSGDSEPIAGETPTPLRNVRTRITMPEPRPQSHSIPPLDHMDRVSNLRNSRDRLESQYILTGYDYGEDIGDRNVDGLYTYSSTTVDSTRPMIQMPLAPQPSSLTPKSSSLVKNPRSMSTIQELTLVATVCLAHFLTQAGLAQSIAPLPLIASSFTTSTHRPSPSWYSAAYSLTVGTFILPSGRLGDIYGPKRLFVLGWLWFTISSLGAGFNPRIVESVDQKDSGGGEAFFCFCRAMQGIGPALLMPNGLAILGRTYEQGNRKNMAFALFGSSAPVGFVIGCVMSSLLAEKTHWSWAYWGLAIACAFMAIVSVSIIPSFPGTEASANQDDDTPENGGTRKVPMWKKLDVPGTILGVIGLVLINVALNQAPLASWSTPYTYFLLIIGLIILCFFFFIDFTPFLTPHPLIPLATLSLDTCFALACIACGWGTFGIWIFYIWEFLETLRELSPLLASAQFAPAAISGLLAALTTGFLLSKTTPQVIMVLSLCAFFIGTTLIATAPVDQIYWAQAFCSIIVMPWGMDMSFPSATILLSSKVGHEHQGVAMSLVNTVVNYSISIGLALAATVQSSVDKDRTQILTGYRSAWYFAMGLSGTGIAIAVIFVVISAWKAKGVPREKEDVGEA